MKKNKFRDKKKLHRITLNFPVELRDALRAIRRGGWSGVVSNILFQNMETLAKAAKKSPSKEFYIDDVEDELRSQGVGYKIAELHTKKVQNQMVVDFQSAVRILERKDITSLPFKRK